MDTAAIRLAVAAVRPKVAAVEIEPAGIFVRVMTGKERAEFSLDAFGADGENDDPAVNEKLIVRCMCDAQGNRVYKDEDAEGIRSLPHDFIKAISDAAAQINGMFKKQQDAAEKNSSGTRTPGSGSGSPAS